VSTGSEFAAGVCLVFGLDPAGLEVAALPGSTNRLWRLTCGPGEFVVKEFPYYDEARVTTLTAAAEFEHSVWRSGGLAMPEPVRARGGELIRRLPGSRGQVVSVRVHRWLEGAPAEPRVAATAEAAGRALAAVQRAGSASARTRPGSLHWWLEDPVALVRRMRRAGFLSRGQLALAESSLAAAEPVLAAAEQLPGAWTYTHCDFKPENSLLTGGQVAVLDWDECGHCHPRLEAMESALRWSGADAGEPDAAAFGAFLRGYQNTAGDLGALRAADFGKRIAALIYWIVFTGKRALGGFGDTDCDAERASSAGAAAETIGVLDRTVASVDRWSRQLSAR
jgi:Ser/Thr protein kinase RdoA (MazF antagonist)